VRKVTGTGIPTSSPKENKGHYPNLEDFQEICEDSMLIHNGEMVAIILHAFVPSIEASEHIQTLGVSNGVVWAQVLSWRSHCGQVGTL
jgi:hypothetical protein